MLKKASMLMLVGLLAVLFAGCAVSKKEGSAKVKCPACGYEFQVPADGGR